MSDKLRNTLQNIPEFALGEQPDPFKLNQSFRVIQQALNQLEETLGDVTVKSTANTNLSDNPLLMGSIGRYIGPTQSISPPMPVNQQFTFTASLEVGRNIWTLPLWPYDGTSLDVSVTPVGATDFNGVNLFQTRKLVSEELLVSGDWKYDTNRNTIISYNPMAGGVAGVSGTSHFNADSGYGGLGEFWHAGNAVPNVQPSFSVTTPASIVVGASTNANYNHTVTMNTEAFQWRGPILGTDSLHEDEGDLLLRAFSFDTIRRGASPIYSVTSQVQQRIPYELDSLSVNDEIPRPFILLYDDTNSKLYETARYYYRDSTSFFFKGPTLTPANAFRVISPGGADLSSTVEGLQFAGKHHGHSGPQAISHLDLMQTEYGPEPTDHPAHIIADKSYGWHRSTVTSAIKGNPHPQYLMRNGYAHGMDSANLDGVMVGELGLAQKTGDVAYRSIAEIWDRDDVESWPVVFGGRSQVRMSRLNSNLLSPSDLLLVVSGRGGTNVTNHARNVGLVANELSPSYFDCSSTDSHFESASSNWVFGRFNSGTGVPPVFLRSSLSIRGTDLRIGADVTNSNLDISGMHGFVDGKIENSNIATAGYDVDLTVSASPGSPSNIDVKVNGYNLTANVYDSTNSKIEIVGSNFLVTSTNIVNASIEIVSDGAFSQAPVDNFGTSTLPISPGTKYIRCKDFYVDADQRVIRRPIIKSEIRYLEPSPPVGTYRLIERGEMLWDDTIIGEANIANFVQYPSTLTSDSLMLYDFDLPQDAALSKVHLVMLRRVTPLAPDPSFEILGFDLLGNQTVVLANTSHAEAVDSVTREILDWDLGDPGLIVNGNRFPSEDAYQLTLRASDGPTLLFGWYEYRLMRQ